ncbi:kinase-like domain-containing protein [Mycena metata]|uniref:cAMP-dependent protein kinase n=1 Tax=Mycena metata TaxID=1033252 RepID=A0AAD7JKI5_9AGAR|nr:kinase-like domain-containing protein [Mycena metata]
MAPIRSAPMLSKDKPYSNKRDPRPPTGYNLKRKTHGLTAGAEFKAFYENTHDGPEPYYFPLPLPVPEGIRPADPRGPPLTLDDLECIRLLGGGGNGHVLLVQTRQRAVPKLFALKAVKKKDLRQQEIGSPGDTGTISRERRALVDMPWNPFISGLLQTFHDDRNVYMMLEYSPCGAFHELMRSRDPLAPADILFYFANIVCGLEFLERYEIAHRDLKPGNIVVGADGYLSLCDFGAAKTNIDGPSVDTWIGEGTPAYQAPECISAKGQSLHLRYGTAVDWWSAGVILFEMATGQMPFEPQHSHADHAPATDFWKAIMGSALHWPTNAQVGRKLKSLVKGLLTVNANKRLGAHGVLDVMEHPWLATVDWAKMRRKRYIPPRLGTPVTSLSSRAKTLNPKHYPGLHFVN